MEYRTLIFLFFCIAGIAIAVNTSDEDNNEDNNIGGDFSFGENDDTSEEAIQASSMSSTSKKSTWRSLNAIVFKADKHIDFFVYERNNMDNPHSLKFDSTDGSKYLKKEWRTVIFIHGWRSKDNLIYKLKTAYTAQNDPNLNLIEVNWKEGSSNPMYFPCAKRVSSVGKTVAKFIVNNREYIDFGKLIIIGHSLGAHAAGYAGKFLKKNYELTVPEIIGLDPAGINFQGKKEKLQPDDAKNVIVFHSSGSLGHLEPLGTVDVYINGGKIQPNMDQFASHRFSKVFYTDIIGGMEVLIGYRYSSFDEVKAGKIPIMNENNKIKLFHGEDFPPRGTLVYVSTQDQKKSLRQPVQKLMIAKRFTKK